MAEVSATHRKPVWVSSTAATPVGLASDLAFAAHPSVTLPSDLGSAGSAADTGVIRPGDDGTVEPRAALGLGVAPDEAWLRAMTTRHIVLHA
jgi:hypothetical protein